MLYMQGAFDLSRYCDVATNETALSVLKNSITNMPGGWTMKGGYFPRDTFRWQCEVKCTSALYEYENKELLAIARHALDTFGDEKSRIFGIFCNLYRDGEYYTPYHRDSYSLREDALTITYSFGATRRFLMKPDDGSETKKFDLSDGDIFVMTKEDNETHKHSIPKTRKRLGERISVVCFLEGDEMDADIEDLIRDML